jgi:serine/threonine protein kinase
MHSNISRILSILSCILIFLKLIGLAVGNTRWNMVVMDVVNNGYCEFGSQTPALFGQMEDKLVRLHQAGYVHGDIHDVNIMVQGDGSGFMLLDFDWAGKIGEAKYPMNVYAGPDLWHPEEACDGELIKAEHDLQMLNALFGCIP